MAATPRTTKRIQDAFSLARHNRYEDLKEILECDSPPFHPDTSDPKGNSILLVACQNGLKRIVKLALKCGADINHRNGAGNTALHFCYMYGFGKTLGTYLMEKGADETIRNRRSQTCFDVTMKPGGADCGESDDSPSKSMNASFEQIDEEEYEEEYDEEITPYDNENAEILDYSYNDAQHGGGAGWESDYLEQYVDGGYESNEVWGATADEAENDNDFWGAKAGDDDQYAVQYGDDGSHHYTDPDSGRACFCNAEGIHFWWDGEAESWIELPTAESKDDGEDNEAKGGGGDDDEEKWAVRPHEELYKNKFKVSTTKRRPPPKPASKRPPPTSARPPPVDTSAPKRQPPKGPNPKTPKALGATPTSMYKGDDDDPQLQLMEAVASHNIKYINSILANPQLHPRDVHAALLNATTKGSARIVECLMKKANAHSANACLVIACKLANVDVIKAILPKTDQSGQVRGMVTVAGTGHTQLFSLFFTPNDKVSDRQAFDRHDVQRVLMSCVAKNMHSALRKLLPLLDKPDVDLPQICTGALTSAIVKGNLESAAALAHYVPTEKLSPALAASSSNGSVDSANIIIRAFYKRHEACGADEWEAQRDFFLATLRHCVEIATSKGKTEVADMLKKELAKGGSVGGAGRHSAAELIGTKRSMQNIVSKR
jgi:hypothetical protein